MKKNWKLLLSIIIGIISLYYAYTVFIYFDTFGLQRIGKLDNFVPLISRSGLFSISTPEGWEEQKSLKYHSDVENLISIIYSKNITAKVNVFKIDDEGTDLMQIVEWNKNKINSLGGNIISSSQIQLGKGSGILLELTYQQQLMYKMYTSHCYNWISEDNEGYIFWFCMNDRIWTYGEPIFKKMIESIEIF